jgi:hypothetical protein
MRSEKRALRDQPVSANGSIRPDVIAIKLSPAFGNLNGSKPGKKDERIAATGLSYEGSSMTFGNASWSAPTFDDSANTPTVRRFTSAWVGADPARTTCWRAPARHRSRPVRRQRASSPRLSSFHPERR